MKPTRERRMTEAQWRDLDDLRKYWHVFCDADPVPVENFIKRMDAAGYAHLRPVRKADLESDPFAAERGIEKGGMLWELTAKGERAFHLKPMLRLSPLA